MRQGAQGPASGLVVEIALHGPFAARAVPSGADLTPRPHKARAILAMLALAPEHRRGRRWIEERLWSDRAPAQAAGSLRQALVDLRRALGDHDGILEAGRDWIALRAGAVRIATGTAGGDLLDGVFVRDPAFLRWLESVRRGAGPAVPLAAGEAEPGGTAQGREAVPVVIRCATANLPGTGSAVVAEIIAARIAEDIADHVSVATLVAAPGAPCDLEITCNVVENDGVCLAFIRVVHQPSGRVVFTRDCRFVGTSTALAGSEALIQAAWEAAERTVGRVPHVLGIATRATKSAALGQLALHKMFSFDQAQLGEADRLMEQAYEVEGNAVHLAWRGLLQMVKAIELGQAQRPELHDMAQSLTRHAMEHPGGNATVKALVSQTRAMLFGDANAAGQAAAQALEANPRNPFALQAMAVARMLAGDGEAAYRLSAQGRAHASRSAFRHWWDAHHATVCIATGRLEEATLAAEAAAFGAPSLRPAYRYLMSLHAHRGDLDAARRMHERLEALEPGFTLERMLEDPDYPVRTLRQTGLLQDVRKLI